MSITRVLVGQTCVPVMDLECNTWEWLWNGSLSWCWIQIIHQLLKYNQRSWWIMGQIAKNSIMSTHHHPSCVVCCYLVLISSGAPRMKHFTICSILCKNSFLNHKTQQQTWIDKLLSPPNQIKLSGGGLVRISPAHP
jgi:hypothetical protein